MTASARAGHSLECDVVRTRAELTSHYDIRHAVFVAEQRIFTGHDRDEHDPAPTTIHLLGRVGGVAAGAVRLYPLDPDDRGGEWQGDRLAVLPEYRSSGLGAPLVRLAVATAGAFGGRAMVAHIQLANRVFFRRLGWTQRGEPEIYLGRPHLLMDIPLDGR
jgi:putative N-acetyltransferase (TIGR04045 family)